MLAQGEQFQVDAHRTGMRIGDEAEPMRDVSVTEAFRDEHLDARTDQFGAAVSEQRLSLGV